MGCYSFTVRDFHSLLLTGLRRRTFGRKARGPVGRLWLPGCVHRRFESASDGDQCRFDLGYEQSLLKAAWCPQFDCVFCPVGRNHCCIERQFLRAGGRCNFSEIGAWQTELGEITSEVTIIQFCTRPMQTSARSWCAGVKAVSALARQVTPTIPILHPPTSRNALNFFASAIGG